MFGIQPLNESTAAKAIAPSQMPLPSESTFERSSSVTSSRSFTPSLSSSSSLPLITPSLSKSQLSWRVSGSQESVVEVVGVDPASSSSVKSSLSSFASTESGKPSLSESTSPLLTAVMIACISAAVGFVGSANGLGVLAENASW